jgi:hypothetical protein
MFRPSPEPKLGDCARSRVVSEIAIIAQIYARLNLDPVRESVNKASDAMLLAAGVAGLLNH